jgi:hypothetical protein
MEKNCDKLKWIKYGRSPQSEYDEDEGTDCSNKRNLLVATAACQPPVGHPLCFILLFFSTVRHQELNQKKIPLSFPQSLIWFSFPAA